MGQIKDTLDNLLKSTQLRGRRPDGGVVTQRIANPCTPVRFRLGPPISLHLICDRHCYAPCPVCALAYSAVQ